MNPAYKPGLAELVLLHLSQEFAAVKEGEPVAVPGPFPASRLAEHDKGIVLVAAGSPDASYGLDSMVQAGALHILFPGMPSVKGDPLKVPILPVQIQAGRLFQDQGLLPPVGQLHGPGDHIQLLQNPIHQLCLQARCLVLQPDGQGPGFCFLPVYGR